MARFCPVCGKKDSEISFHGELCVECARERLPPLPTVRVAVCQKCGAVVDRASKRKGGGLEEEAVRLLKLKGAAPVFSPGFASVEYGTPAGRISRPLTLIVEKRLCADCSRSHSQYFEAIIQLRGEPKRVERMAHLLIRQIERKSFVPKVEEPKEGIDIYVGSRNEAIAALNSQSLGFLRTEKLAGQKDGKKLYRTTLLVRL